MVLYHYSRGDQLSDPHMSGIFRRVLCGSGAALVQWRLSFRREVVGGPRVYASPRRLACGRRYYLSSGGVGSGRTKLRRELESERVIPRFSGIFFLCPPPARSPSFVLVPHARVCPLALLPGLAGSSLPRLVETLAFCPSLHRQRWFYGDEGWRAFPRPTLRRCAESSIVRRSSRRKITNIQVPRNEVRSRYLIQRRC